MSEFIFGCMVALVSEIICFGGLFIVLRNVLKDKNVSKRGKISYLVFILALSLLMGWFLGTSLGSFSAEQIP